MAKFTVKIRVFAYHSATCMAIDESWAFYELTTGELSKVIHKLKKKGPAASAWLRRNLKYEVVRILRGSA